MIKDFNFGWRFSKGNIDGAEAQKFDDSNWENVNLPHDWAISGPFGELTEDGGTGKLPWEGEGWYRKSFELSEADKGKRLSILFDGVMANPVVYLNGKKVGSWIYGYNSFIVDATDAAEFGGENILAVHADTTRHNSRWYPGAGIYRKVTARLVDPVHIPEWGVFVTTPEVNKTSATINAKIEVENKSGGAKNISIQTVLLDPSGKEVASQSVDENIEASKSVNLDFVITNPELWDVEHAHLYEAVTKVSVDGTVVDENITTFGIRTFEWTVDDGFHLNGRRVQVNGVNLHHDHGPLGAAFFPRAMERQLQIMKDMGVNSIRTSHNPSAPELLELCDRMGLVVFNELYDKYDQTGGAEGTHIDYVYDFAEREVRNFVMRDRNHACVCIWSIGNEIREILQDVEGKSCELVTKMVEYFNKYDDTRPTTMGCHIPGGADKEKHIFDALDSAGWNYSQKYIPFRKNYPDKPVIYSETASAFGTRGAYKLDMPIAKTDWGHDGEVTAHVLTSATWSDIPECEFERMLRHKYVAGEYVWTGFDYLGEPTPYNEPGLSEKGYQARSSYFGIVDLVGLPKDSYYLYRSHWLPEENTVHLAPHWNWEAGQTVPVFAYTNGDEAELFLNGKSLGRKAKKLGVDQSGNLALWKQASASSEEIIQDAKGNVQEENYAGKAIDENTTTRWRADSAELPQYWQIDLQEPTAFQSAILTWEDEAFENEFYFEVSYDEASWTKIDVERVDSGSRTIATVAQTTARFVRVVITKCKAGSKASMCWFELYDKPASLSDNSKDIESPYFSIIDKYRLRWMDVAYESGELKVVAYKDGKEIGQTCVNTATDPAALRLTADRTEIKADGMDLCYVTIEMTDADGNVCPCAMDRLNFAVDGAIEFMGAGNGNQMGHDSFTADNHPLFYGKAVVILRSKHASSGRSTLNVSTETGISAELNINVC